MTTWLPTIAVGTRRLHDIGRSGWWQLLMLVPIVGVIVLILWWARDGEEPPTSGAPSPGVAAAA